MLTSDNCVFNEDPLETCQEVLNRLSKAQYELANCHVTLSLFEDCLSSEPSMESISTNNINLINNFTKTSALSCNNNLLISNLVTKSSELQEEPNISLINKLASHYEYDMYSKAIKQSQKRLCKINERSVYQCSKSKRETLEASAKLSSKDDNNVIMVNTCHTAVNKNNDSNDFQQKNELIKKLKNVLQAQLELQKHVQKLHEELLTRNHALDKVNKNEEQLVTRLKNLEEYISVLLCELDPQKKFHNLSGLKCNCFINNVDNNLNQLSNYSDPPQYLTKLTGIEKLDFAITNIIKTEEGLPSKNVDSISNDTSRSKTVMSKCNQNCSIDGEYYNARLSDNLNNNSNLGLEISNLSESALHELLSYLEKCIPSLDTVTKNLEVMEEICSLTNSNDIAMPASSTDSNKTQCWS